MEKKSHKVKINLLTGFFGSGKTTLISNIIKLEKLNSRIAIVQNEFSEEMGIEKEILRDSKGDILGDLFELPNGCLCCAVKDDMIMFLEKLITKKSEIELIIVESHGISDISMLLKRFWLDQELESSLYLNSIYCLIDCFNFNKNKNCSYDIFVNQIISADKILLNKVDKINNDESEIKTIKDFIFSINPLASIKETEYSNIPIDYFLEETALNNIIDFKEIDNKNNELKHEHYHEIFEIENLVVRTSIKNINDLDKAIGRILWDYVDQYGFSIIRFKGIFYDEESKKYNIQGLYDLYEINEIQSKYENFNYESKILFIGKKLIQNKLIIEKILLNLNY